MNLHLTYDSRDKLFHQHFGQTTDLPLEINFDTQLPDQIQPYGDIKCTCYTTCDIAEDQENLEFDIDDLWKRISHFSDGASPRDALAEAVRNGLLVKGETERRKDWRSYWRGDLGSQDAFDNLRSTIFLAKSPVGIGTHWYDEWNGPLILPVGVTERGGHMYAAEGWKQIDGEPHLIIEAWVGRKLYMPRATFNAAIKAPGMQTWVLSTAELDAKRIKTLTETIKDLCINLIIRLRDFIKTHGVEPVVPESIFDTPPLPPTPSPAPVLNHPPLLDMFCAAIRDYEGGPNDRNYRNNNPGNCRYSSKGYDPKYGLVLKDKDNFAIFSNYATGWMYLQNLIRQKINENPQRTIREFFYDYAPVSDGNAPETYALFVARRLGVSKDFFIKDLLSSSVV